MEERGQENTGTVETQVFWLPKKGAGAEEYEDAFSFSEQDSPDDQTPFRVAVADGATESAFARRWARLLVERFATHGPATLAEERPAVQRAWADAVDAQTDTLPWYAAAKAADGAFATLLGLTLRPSAGGDPDAGAWQAISAGDSNLFHLHSGDALLRAWPREEATDFDMRPALLSSRPGAAAPEARRAEGAFAPGDAFVLATDAAAAWLLRTDPAGALRWNDQAAFAGAARRARAEGLLKNDDTTVVTVQTA